MLKGTSRLTIPNDPRYVKSAVSFCRDLALSVGFTKKEVRQITSALREAATKVATRAFNPYETESFEIIFTVEEEGLRITIDETGLPFTEFLAKGEKSAAMRAIERNMDDVVFVNRGRGGYELRMVKHLKGRHVEEIFTEEDLRPFGVCTLPPRDLAIEIRLMRPEEAPLVSRCIYRAYRYTYLKEDLYFPERVEAMNREGRLVSAVAVTEDGEMVGHFALMPRPNGRVAEVGAAVVIPEYRGRGLMKKLLSFLMEEAGRRSLVALYGNAVTVHDLSQRTNLRFGFRETALQLGWFPPLSLRIMTERGMKSAGNIITFYRYIKRPASRPVYPPPHCRKMIERIYSGLGIERELENPFFLPSGGLAEESDIRLAIKPLHRAAVIEVKRPGRDLTGRIRAKVVELDKKGFGAVFLDLLLEEPFTPEAAILAEELGFFFSGILPDYSEGDVLRLQRYKTEVDYDEIHTSSAFASELLDYIKSTDPVWKALRFGRP